MRNALDSLLTTAIAVAPADAGAVWLLDAVSDTLTLAASQGAPEGWLPQQVVLSDQTHDQQALAEGIAQTVGAAEPFPVRLCLRLGPPDRPLGTLHLYA